MAGFTSDKEADTPLDPWLKQAVVHPEDFGYRALVGLDKWEKWTPTFTSLTLVGTLTVSAFYRTVGAQMFFQIQFSGSTSIASVAATTYFALPVQAKGLDGMASMTDKTAHTFIGGCEIDAVNSRCYMAAQGASANVFKISGHYEIAG